MATRPMVPVFKNAPKYLKKAVGDEALDVSRINLSVTARKLQDDSEPRCDFCAAATPVVIYAASRNSGGENQQVWRWMACSTCERLVDNDNWAGVRERLLITLAARMPNVDAEILIRAADTSLNEFHRFAIRAREPKGLLTDAETKEIFDFLEHHDPELWKRCYPRIYSENPRCGDYYSPKTPARQMAAIAMKIMNGTIGKSEQYEFLVASQLCRFNVPMYWLSADVAEAIRQTTPPGNIDWYDMPLPFEAAVFMLPKGSIRHPTEGNVEFVAYGRFRSSERLVSKLIPGRPYGEINGGLTLLAYTKAGNLTHWNMPLDTFGKHINLPDAEEMVDRFKDDRHESGWYWQPEMTHEDNMMIVELLHIIFGTLLLMTKRPDLVNVGTRRKLIAATAKKPAREFWSPTIIGENYRIRREAGPSTGGTHASPRFHWVRGFYKEQPYGAGRKLVKTIWIEPYMRGLDAL